MHQICYFQYNIFLFFLLGIFIYVDTCSVITKPVIIITVSYCIMTYNIINNSYGGYSVFLKKKTMHILLVIRLCCENFFLCLTL